MGIQGLLPALKSIQQRTHIRAFAGQTVGVDGYVWLHKGAFACAWELALGKDTTKYIDYVMKRVKMLQYYNVRPYVVLDGDFLPSKAKTEIERQKQRVESRALGMTCFAKGQKKQAMQHFQRCLDVTPEMAHRFIIELRKEQIDYIVAPYEADAQLAYLEKKGLISAVITEDSDLLVYGCKKVLFKMDICGDCIEIDRSKLAATRDGFSDDTFRHMAMLSGCDYLANIPSVGIKTAQKYMYQYKTIDKCFRAMEMNPALQIPYGYEQDFYRADLTFRHQRVFCPISNSLVMLNEPEDPSILEGQDFIGSLLFSDVAQGIARGDLCPITKRPFSGIGKENIPPRGKITSFFDTKSSIKSASVLWDSSNYTDHSKTSVVHNAQIHISKRPLVPVPVNGHIAKRLKLFSTDLIATDTSSTYFNPPNIQQIRSFRTVKEQTKCELPITRVGESKQVDSDTAGVISKGQVSTTNKESSPNSPCGPMKCPQYWPSTFVTNKILHTLVPAKTTNSLSKLGAEAIQRAKNNNLKQQISSMSMTSHFLESVNVDNNDLLVVGLNGVVAGGYYLG